MKTLTIKDLARTEELSSTAMAGVRGGWTMNSTYFKAGDITYAPSYDSSIDAMQSLMQNQENLVATANQSAFVEGVHVDNTLLQDGKNVIIRN
jgi:hypothetical protein